MSQEHVELVRRAVEALNRGDLSGAIKEMAADFVFDFSRSMSPERGVYGGWTFRASRLIRRGLGIGALSRKRSSRQPVGS